MSCVHIHVCMWVCICHKCTWNSTRTVLSVINIYIYLLLPHTSYRYPGVLVPSYSFFLTNFIHINPKHFQQFYCIRRVTGLFCFHDQFYFVLPDFLAQPHPYQIHVGPILSWQPTDRRCTQQQRQSQLSVHHTTPPHTTTNRPTRTPLPHPTYLSN